VVRFADKASHQVFLEPESLRDDWVYCNGISTSLPADVQDRIVRSLPGCERAHIYRYGYAVEYDMVKPHQIGATGMTKLVEGLFLAGQINGTSGYEEAAGQGLIAGINAARLALGHEPITLGRDQAYIGVMMDDLVTKTPTEPYRMFTSRAEHRLLLRADNAADRLTPLAMDLGLLDGTELGRLRRGALDERREQMGHLRALIATARVPAREGAGDGGGVGGAFLRDLVRRPEFTPADLGRIAEQQGLARTTDRVRLSVLADVQYDAYIARQHAEVRRQEGMERRRIPGRALCERALSHLRTEARQSLLKFRPATFGQAGRLEGITPADLTLLSVLIRKDAEERATGACAET
jgi:tRNA uridine 5-carboxymethylaminomethyl modification enzyme